MQAIPQNIIDSVNKQMAKERELARQQGDLNKQEMILLYNILTNLYDSFDSDLFGCDKGEYNRIIRRLDALTE